MDTAKQIAKRRTPFQAIVFYYFIAIVVSFILLILPGVHKEGVTVALIDSLFTAVSAVSVTGLTVVSISETYSTFGLAMLLVVLQLGAVGIMSLGTFIWLMVGKKIGLRERQLIMVDHNQSNLSGVVALIKEIIKILVTIELTGATILTLYFLKYYDSFSEALLHGVFTAISATTNGGFDITGISMVAYRDDYFIQVVNMLLIILGAIGFPVLIEVKHFLQHKKGHLFKFSLFTKITTTTYVALFIVGTITIFLIESFHAFKGMSWHERLFAAMFQSVSTRSAGLTTIDPTAFTDATDMFLSFLMFIGASPSSVGGGIRTTTFAIAVLFLINFAKGKETIQVFGREVYMIDVFRSYVVIIMAITLVLISTMILSLTENASILQIVFEITSAFGTCGMSLGITSDLSVVGKIVIMILMFVGRVGLLSFLFSIGGKAEKPHYSYPKERVIIG